MENIYDKYFKTTEFAEACGVTKHTLFHYDDIDILKPEVVTDNGYRYYSINQFFAFDIISVLKEAGTPLKDVKKYFEQHDTEQFLTLLEEKKKDLETERINLERMQGILQNTIEMATYSMHMTYGQPRIDVCQEEYLIAIKIPLQFTGKKRLQKISELYKYCKDHCFSQSYPNGIIISKDTIENNLTELFEKANYFFFKTDDGCDSEWLYIKPKGKYAIIGHEGSYESLPASYEKLKNHITKNHLTIIGNTYESYITTGTSEKYVIEIAIQVE
ncbi:MerR family transcriptional regulator [Clostridium estertheticum]|uniref:MerR family transcriptional regulator n=1 Tax=Clostridium estertheticum TaxID=238834 RepID=UPI001C0B72B4|nr:MerR family transcriptional regulator [Clostridium estertheticum]MBU3076049.1 MerR family transcriptional regulator [Clostridium estertheticum]MBU3166169.1 MerR family transcriptional regulator [Clostridium estertheticum]